MVSEQSLNKHEGNFLTNFESVNDWQNSDSTVSHHDHGSIKARVALSEEGPAKSEAIIANHGASILQKKCTVSSKCCYLLV